MESDEREFLCTTAWMFAQHGQRTRARTLCAALVEDNPRDGIAAAVLAETMLADREPEAALKVLRQADFPPVLERTEALLESRALQMLGREEEARRRWRRYVASAKGTGRKWITDRG